PPWQPPPWRRCALRRRRPARALFRRARREVPTCLPYAYALLAVIAEISDARPASLLSCLLGYAVVSTAREAGSPDGWNTPRTRIGTDPEFSRLCSTSGGRWMHDPGSSGVSTSLRWSTPCPSRMYTTSS